MDLLTQSKDANYKRIVELYVEQGLVIQKHINGKERCKFIIIEDCSGSFTLNNSVVNFSSPYVLCLNQNDVINFNSTTLEHLTCLYFHPRVLNDLFEFEFFKNFDFDKLNLTTRQDALLLDIFFNLDANLPNRYKISVDKCFQLKKLIDNIYNELKNQPDGYWPCRSRSYFIELIININQLDYLIKKTDDNDYLQEVTSNDVLEYLSEHIADKISLSHLTKKYLMNRNKLNEIVKAKTGMTAIQYLNNTRINVATHLILNTSLTIREIASRVGYDNASDFSNFFKKSIGISPRNYRDNVFLNSERADIV